MKATNFKTICVAAAVALFLSVNVQAQDKMVKDTTKMSKMDHKKMSKKKMSKMPKSKMTKDTTKKM